MYRPSGLPDNLGHEITNLNEKCRYQINRQGTWKKALQNPRALLASLSTNRVMQYLHDAPFGGLERRESLDRILLLPVYSEAESYFGRLSPKSATFKCLASLSKLLKLPTASPHLSETIPFLYHIQNRALKAKDKHYDQLILTTSYKDYIKIILENQCHLQFSPHYKRCFMPDI